MKRLAGNIRSPVRREGAENHLLLILLSFGSSVALTRLFLEITDYPQLGGETIHIAHVLWGGVLLFIAALLPLIYANRWAYTGAAVLAGLGVGLFIDEVGKFITQNNDYFYPAAAPIIYAFFLLTVIIYLRTKRPTARNPRAEFYRALDSFQEILDRDLEAQELLDLIDRLRYVVQHSESKAIARLAQELLNFLVSGSLSITTEKLSFLERFDKFWKSLEAKILTRTRSRAILSGGLFSLGVISLRNFVQTYNAENISALLAEGIPNVLNRYSLGDFYWLFTRLSVELLVGSILLIASILFLMRVERLAIPFAYFSLLISLTISNLIVFYFEQFSAILPALVQLLMLLGVLRYRLRFIKPSVGIDDLG